MTKCTRCGSGRVIKYGQTAGKQRFVCKECGKNFGVGGKYSPARKHTAVVMYLNNVGIRRIGYFLNVSHVLVLNWIKRAYRDLAYRLQNRAGASEEPDVIELDEVYTFVKKNLKDQDLQYGLLIAGEKAVLLRLK